MSPKTLILSLIDSGANEREAIELFMQHGFGYKSAKAIMKEYGLCFPPAQDYNDLHPSPERIQRLQELSTTF